MIALAGLFTAIGSVFVPRLFTGTVAIAGVAFVIIGIGIERTLFRYVCSACGNRVEKHSNLCPTCRCILQRPSGKTGFIFILVTVLIIGYGVMRLLSHRQ